MRRFSLLAAACVSRRYLLILATLATVFCGVPSASAQSLDRVSGSFLTVGIADSAGWTSPNCTGRDLECDFTWGWATSSISVSDPDLTTGTKACVDFDSPACATSAIGLQSVSATEKKIVWQPKLFGQSVGVPMFPTPPPAFAFAYAFNDLVLKVTDSSNPNDRYKVEVQVLVGAGTGDDVTPVYVEVGNDGHRNGTFSLSVDVGLNEGTEMLGSELECADNQTVSSWGAQIYSDSWGIGCNEVHEPGTGYTNLGTVCQGSQFRLGFRLKAEGQAVFQTHGTDDTCGGQTNCAGSSALQVVLLVRVVADGTCQ